MKKLILAAVCALFVVGSSAFTEREEGKISEAKCDVEMTSEIRITAFEGKAISVGQCDWVLKLCSNGSLRMMSKSGVSPVAGQYYRVTSDGFDNCGYKVTSMYSSSCTLP